MALIECVFHARASKTEKWSGDIFIDNQRSRISNQRAYIHYDANAQFEYTNDY